MGKFEYLRIFVINLITATHTSNKEHRSIQSAGSVLCPQQQRLQQFRHPVALKKTKDILTSKLHASINKNTIVPLKGHGGTQVAPSLVFVNMLNNKQWFQGFVRSWMINGLFESVLHPHYLTVPQKIGAPKCMNMQVDILACELELLTVKPQGSTASASKKQSLPNSHQNTDISQI